jgi:two-component system chemotaxis sensor kinase CheA
MTASPGLSRLLETFLEELEERVTALESDLLAIERTHDPAARTELAASVFRSIHSLKGASHAVGVRSLESLCHDLESRLAEARSDVRRFDADLTQDLMAATDVLADAGRRLRAGEAAETLKLGSPAHIHLGAEPVTATAVARAEPLTVMVHVPTAELLPTPGLQIGADAAAAAEATVTLRADVLDALIAVSGEVVVARERLAVATDGLHELDAFIASWRKRWAVERTDASAAGVTDHASAQRIDERLAALDTLVADRVARTAAAVRDHERVASGLDGRLRKLGLQPFAVACKGLERVVRDVARGLGKEVRLEVIGETLELDRAVLARLRDPLRHLVRNAIDHGLEPAAERAVLGKAPIGTIRVSAMLAGDRVEITVEDDGRGVDERAVREHAAARGLPVPRDQGALSRLLFSAGFSTKSVASNVSGRGVGLDAVRTTVEAILGRVRLAWTPGHGTRFTLQVPLSLATEHSVLVRAGGSTFALPTRDVRRAVQVQSDDLRTLDGRATLVQGGSRPVPIHDLATTLGLPPRESTSAAVAVLVGWDDREVAFIVDEVLEARDLIVMPLGRRLRDLPVIVGGAILGNGDIALLLDAARLVSGPVASTEAVPMPRAANATGKRGVLPRILAVDDSATTRSLLRSILEAGGNEVAVAYDGADAWAALQLRVPDLIVSDVDMPRMNGLDLCAKVRDSVTLRGVPFVLVTSLGSAHDRQRGMEVGADAYIVKAEFDQGTLLDTVRRLLA